MVTEPAESDLIVLRPEGLYCPAGDFHIDPWRPVARAVITHAHADHARRGHAAYLCSAPGEGVLRARLGGIALQTLAYGQRLAIGSASVSLHPAGHVLGSAQVRVEHRGRVWVASGDYWLTGAQVAGAQEAQRAHGAAAALGASGVPVAPVAPANATCDAFEPVRCDCFITESTFGLPIYRWRPPGEVFADINRWWAGNAQAGQASLLLAYSFGKAQRLLAGVDSSIGPIVVHGAVEDLNRAYRAAGVRLPETLRLEEVSDRSLLRRALVVAPPSVQGSAWAARLGECSHAFASGWMQLRGARRRQGLDRGFVLSDHADWPGLQRAIAATGAQRVIVTHGYEAVMVRWLQQQGLEAGSFRTAFGQEEGVDTARPEQPAEPVL
ncbi:MAG: ligase-associated DNA damage response exonuclease [Betaproteobacteria bacterium]|jgi:putative mRNA 3-end processing factor